MELTDLQLTDRQETVLRALVSAYVGEAAPVGSASLARLLPVPLSSASVRNTMSELTELGLIEQPHTSAGRLPTETGLRVFVDCLMDPRSPVEWERRLIAGALEDAGPESSPRRASQLLSERTSQLGFVVLPRLERVVLRHLSLIRLSSERVLAVLVSASGVAYERLFDDSESGSQAELDRLAIRLKERLAGCTLLELRGALEREARDLRSRAALLHAVRTLAQEASREGDVVFSTHLALLDQPEFHEPTRLRELLEALETRESLLAVVDRVLERPGVAVTFGSEVDEPALRRCAVVTAPCGEGSVGAVGVLGPSRMDYGRVVPLVDLFARLVTEKLLP